MKAIALNISLALAAFAQAPTPELDCSGPRYAITNLAPYCEIRESSLWFAGGTLKVKNEGSGGVTVLPWDEPGVQVRAQVLTGAQTTWSAEALAARVEIDTGTGAVLIRGPRTDNLHRWSVNLLIRVPHGAGLSLQTVNGNIAIHDVEGPISVSNVNGSVTLTRVSGDLTVRVTNGVIRAGVNRWSSQTIDFQTVNGGIELDLPHDTSARVMLSAIAGSISTHITNANRTVAGFWNKIAFDLGGGGSLIRAELVTGYIRLHQTEAPDPLTNGEKEAL